MRSLSLSSKSQRIQQQVNSSQDAKKEVGYNRQFLYNYQPNQTFYLHETTRQHLREIGSTGVEGTPGTFAKRVYEKLLIDLSWNSSRLEGNTYSIFDTKRLLSHHNKAEGKHQDETQMILNHKAAIDFLINSGPWIGINTTTITRLHWLLSQKLLGNREDSGKLRHAPIRIGSSAYAPTANPFVVEECFRLIIDKASQIHDAFEKSFFLLVHLPYLQPFIDVNKRTSRFSANIPLALENLKPLTFVNVDEEHYISGILGVYELNQVELLRDVYVWAYEQSCAQYSELTGAI